ncbi:DUF3085 domain-containing protein, partial [Salmonella enterica]
AKGCHPQKDDNWWETARTEVGDDIGESLDLTESMMNRILNEGKPLHITVRGDSFLIEC